MFITVCVLLTWNSFARAMNERNHCSTFSKVYNLTRFEQIFKRTVQGLTWPEGLFLTNLKVPTPKHGDVRETQMKGHQNYSKISQNVLSRPVSWELLYNFGRSFQECSAWSSNKAQKISDEMVYVWQSSVAYKIGFYSGKVILVLSALTITLQVAK